MNVLICGGRNYTDSGAVMFELQQLKLSDLVIHGGCPTGADYLAGMIARDLGIHVAVVEALWDHYERAAGPLRNQAMLRLGVDKVIAFPGARGTANCVKQAEGMAIPVERVR